MGKRTEPEAAVEFSIGAEQLDGGTVVRVAGELDLSTHERLAEELTSIAAGGNPIVVDLSKCDFIDSSGIRALLIGRQAAEESGSHLALAAAKPQVVRILDVTGVASALPIHPSAEEALAAKP
jgi:anti-sigma B factor antagonist